MLISKSNHFQSILFVFPTTMKCIRCDLQSAVTLRKKDHYCCECFLNGTNHKFRAVIGKNKILARNDKVLLCVSRGISSIMLLDLVHHGISLNVHKKLRIQVEVLHITDLANDEDSIIDILSRCQQYNFNIYFVDISDYLNSNKSLPNVNTAPDICNNYNNEFQHILKKLSPTSYTDFVNKVKRNLFIEYAKLLECKYIFTGENANTLATNLLSNLASGRGSQVQYDNGLLDTRNSNVTIIRPMKDISQEELDLYIEIKGLKVNCNTNAKNNSLQSVIGMFVADLQYNFQATISTVCKTAEKIGVQLEAKETRKCSLCESPIIKRNDKLTALQATNLSRSVSIGKPIEEGNLTKLHASMFPMMDDNLCYSCSKIYAEISVTT